MSDMFAYIASQTTSDPYIPPGTNDIRMLSRDVSDAFAAISGGYQLVGELKFFPVQRSVPGHLLCDGREVSKTSFPELYSLLGNSQGTPVDAENFVLPDYVGAAAFNPAPVAEPETVEEGTVTSPEPTNPDIPDWEWYENPYGGADSGGRYRRMLTE